MARTKIYKNGQWLYTDSVTDSGIFSFSVEDGDLYITATPEALEKFDFTIEQGELYITYEEEE